MRIKQVKKGKERDELLPGPRADLRRALKVRALCQQGDFGRRLTCQEVPGREAVFCLRKGEPPLQAQGNVCGVPKGTPLWQRSSLLEQGSSGIQVVCQCPLNLLLPVMTEVGKGVTDHQK